MFIIVLIISLTLASGVQYLQSDFGISQKIPGVEGHFAVVATDNNGGVYVAFQNTWSENDNEIENYNTYFSYSHDYGKTWSNSFRINDNDTLSVYSDTPSIAVDSENDHVYVAWKDNRTGVAKVYVDKSTDRGLTFGSDVEVYNWQQDYIPPWLPYTVDIKINNSIIYLAWVGYYSDIYTDSNVFFSNSVDGGLTYAPPITLNTIAGDAIITAPWIGVHNNNIYVSYSRRYDTGTVYMVKSQDGGSSFGAPVKVDDGTTQIYTGGPKFDISSDGIIHIVWTDNRAGNGPQYLDIYYASSLDGGQSFTANIRVNDDTVVSAPDPDIHPAFTRGAQGTPMVALDSDDGVHVVWEDLRNFVDDTTYSRDIYYANLETTTQFSANLKITYVDPEAVSVNIADPNLVFDIDDNLFIVFSDAPSGDNEHHSIYFMSVLQSKFTSGSSTTSQPTSTSTTTSTTSTTPLTNQSSDDSSSIFNFQLITMTFVILTLLKRFQSKKLVR